MRYKNDIDLGSQHGRLGFEPKYPNNVNYMFGYKSGARYFLNWCERNRPDDYQFTTNDADISQFHVNMPV